MQYATDLLARSALNSNTAASWCSSTPRSCGKSWDCWITASSNLCSGSQFLWDRTFFSNDPLYVQLIAHENLKHIQRLAWIKGLTAVTQYAYKSIVTHLKLSSLFFIAVLNWDATSQIVNPISKYLFLRSKFNMKGCKKPDFASNTCSGLTQLGTLCLS